MIGDYGVVVKFFFLSWRGEICSNGRGWEIVYKKCICRVYRLAFYFYSFDL